MMKTVIIDYGSGNLHSVAKAFERAAKDFKIKGEVIVSNKPDDLEKAERIVLKGKMNGDVFEITQKDGILIKCPSKYKDDPEVAKKNLDKTQ